MTEAPNPTEPTGYASYWPEPAKGIHGQFLAGVRVLDLSRHLPGPLCTLLLRDLGASVLKIEPPPGDELRQLGPPGIHGDSIYYEAINAGKASLTVDLKTSAGKELILSLVDEADILIESFRPTVMAKLGLSADVLRKRNPRLIFCSVSGFGADGPRAAQAGHDINYLALAGALSFNGMKGRPHFFEPPIADVSASMMAAITILAALNRQSHSNQGCVIDLALADVVMPLQAFRIAELVHGNVPTRETGPLNGGWACYRLYETADGKWISLGAVEPKFWAAFCDTTQRPEWKDRHTDPLPQTELISELDAYFRQATLTEHMQRFEKVDCCIAPVVDLSEAVNDQHALARQLVRQGPDGLLQALFPARIDGTAPEVRPPLYRAD
ncbi:CoA transferase [Rhizobium sp. ARZ01]|uniref:CaiB/BaiF CoA transferase family protein n=1 Tax=Rhizobium sp. ARZ01 TaxID=2769313 RepID=UPI001787746B|nr:CoA transferase [Rhizobium sp. ARZ01]MBD9371032.1 CoA transferase [Rhizobium sp. ARZ01]